ncbi:uroporphyrinogen decarboxylase [Maribacter sp. 2304DJ31-5]|uniref:uroporphyrinogen decarboxylase n=1 Tax=Maribacter sp. 2304DJ31-5 TaxID=3386273 RepID=UPI0039BCF870
MNGIDWIEVLGYLASVLIAVSLMMASMIRLRVFNLIGAFLFGTYGVLIGAFPVAFLNYFIALTNVYYLWKILKTKNHA